MLEIQLNKRIEGIHRMSAEELKSGLARLLDDIRKRGIKKTMEQSPGLLSNIIGKLLEIDSARYFGEAPEVSDMFMDLFWEGVIGIGDPIQKNRTFMTGQHQGFAQRIR